MSKLVDHNYVLYILLSFFHFSIVKNLLLIAPLGLIYHKIKNIELAA